MAFPPYSLEVCPPIDAEHVDRSEGALQDYQARLTVDPADGAPEHGGYQEQRESRGDSTDVERDQNGARDSHRRADPLRGLQWDRIGAPSSHDRFAARRAAAPVASLNW